MQVEVAGEESESERQNTNIQMFFVFFVSFQPYTHRVAAVGTYHTANVGVLFRGTNGRLSIMLSTSVPIPINSWYVTNLDNPNIYVILCYY